MIFLPYAVPGVVAALMWGFIYGDHFGLAADLRVLLFLVVQVPVMLALALVAALAIDSAR